MTAEVTPQAYSIDSFCKAFGIGSTKARGLIKDGKIEARRYGGTTGKLLIPAESARAWFDQLPKRQPQAQAA